MRTRMSIVPEQYVAGVLPDLPVSAQYLANDDPLARDGKEFWCCEQGRWFAGRPEARFIPTFSICDHCWCLRGGPNEKK